MRDRTPDQIIESELDASANGVIPASVMRPGARLVVELDPEGVVPLEAGSQTRYPAEGSMELTVVEPQRFRQIIVPTVSPTSGDESIVDWAQSLDINHADMRLIRSLLPIGDMELEIHETYRTSSVDTFTGWFTWLNDMVTMFHREGRRGYYYGVTTQPCSGSAGSGPHRRSSVRGGQLARCLHP